MQQTRAPPLTEPHAVDDINGSALPLLLIAILAGRRHPFATTIILLLAMQILPLATGTQHLNHLQKLIFTKINKEPAHIATTFTQLMQIINTLIAALVVRKVIRKQVKINKKANKMDSENQAEQAPKHTTTTTPHTTTEKKRPPPPPTLKTSNTPRSTDKPDQN